MQKLFTSVEVFQESELGDTAFNLDEIDASDDDIDELDVVSDYDSPTTDSDEETDST